MEKQQTPETANLDVRGRDLTYEELVQILQAVARSSGGLLPRFKGWIRTAAFHTGLGPLVARLRPKKAFVLLYHKVERRRVGPFGTPALDVDAFERQIEYLSRNFEVVPLSQLADALRRGDSGEHLASITFDDGYRNNLLLAYPVLRRHRVPATVFVTAGLIGTNGWMWTSELTEMALRYGLPAVAAACDDRFLAALLEVELPPAMRIAAGIEYLLRAGVPRRQAVMLRLRKTFAVEPDDENRFLSWDEVRALQAGGFEIGSHTMTHPTLTQLPAAEVERELVASRDAIAEQTGERPKLFCYPHGDFSDSVKRITARYYGAAVSCIAGENTVATDPLELRRIAAYNVEDLAFETARPRWGDSSSSTG